MLAQRLNVANTYLADLMHQYAGQVTISRWSANSCRE